jgi:hypothetical protein
MNGAARTFSGMTAMHPFSLFICLLLTVSLSGRAEPIIFEDQPSWSRGVIDGRFGGDPAEPQSILITVDHALAEGLNVLQPKAKQSYQSLRFKGATAEGVAEMRTLTMHGPLRVDFGREGEVPAQFDQEIIFDFDGRPAVFETATQDSHLEVNGPVRNAKGLIRRGNGARVYLTGGDLEGITGLVQIEGGRLVLRDQAALSGITGVTLFGQREDPAFLAMEGEALSDRLPDTAPVVVAGGAAILLSGGGDRAVSESLGRVTVQDNALQLAVNGKHAGMPVTLTLAELLRDPGSIVVIGGEKFGEAGFVRVDQGNSILAALIGGRGAAGSTTVSIVPWARGFGGGHLNDAYGLLTYAQDTGFRELRPQEYVNGLRAAVRPSDNVHITALEPPMTQAKTINALFCSLPRGLRHRVVDLGDKTLTISSGALSSDSQTAILGGALTTGNNQPLSFVGNFSLNTRLAGRGGAVFYAGEVTRLTNPGNSLTGDWTFAGGRVLTTDDETIPDSVTVRLHSGAELWLEGSESVAAIAGNGVVNPAVGGRSAMMLGFCVAQANQVVLGPGGSILPGDQGKAPAVGHLRIWSTDSDKRIGFLKIEDGTLAIDLAADGNDALVLQSENKAALVSGGTLRVNRLRGFKPKLGAEWEIITGTAPAAGRGFASVVDAGGGNYAYAVTPVGNSWVLTVTTAP